MCFSYLNNFFFFFFLHQIGNFSVNSKIFYFIFGILVSTSLEHFRYTQQLYQQEQQEEPVPQLGEESSATEQKYSHVLQQQQQHEQPQQQHQQVTYLTLIG